MDPEKQPQTSIIQKITCAQEGEKAVAGHIIKLRIWKDGESEQASVVGSYKIGSNELNSDIELIVVQMRVGDSWKIQHHNRITGDLEKINITMVSLQKSEPELQVASANARAEEYKKQGNIAIKQKKYHEAISIYKKGYQLVQYCSDKEAIQIKLSLMSNIVLGTLNSYRFRECLEWCQKSLAESVEPNKKIVYRQINAYKGLKQWELAKEKVGKALIVFKNDQEAMHDFQSQKQTIEREQKDEVAKEKKIYTSMFG